MFSPSASVSAATVYRGHFTESQSEHASEKECDVNDPGEGEISEVYANKMHIEQDVVDFEMGDRETKSVTLEVFPMKF